MQDTTPRYNIYARIHKALRAMMGEALVAAGRCDWSDVAETAATLAELRSLLEVCEGHLAHENQFLHAAMEARAPGSAARTAGEHVEHAAAIKALRTLAAKVEILGGAARIAAGEALYRELAVFVAENYVHMHEEETQNNATLWATHSDAEIHGIEQRLVASIPPQENLFLLRWMLRHTTHQERVAMLAGARAGAPAEVFEGMTGVARGVLGAREWDKLATALNLSGPLAAAA